MIKDFDIILQRGEGYTVEFKETADKTIVDEVCAFANASGGHIYEEHVHYDQMNDEDVKFRHAKLLIYDRHILRDLNISKQRLFNFKNIRLRR